MEKLVARVEGLLADVRETKPGLSPTELLAAKLRSALASNAMGGRVNEDAKWRTMLDAVKDAQAAWQRLAPVHDAEARALEQRFREACRRVNDQARGQSGSHAPRRAAATAAAVPTAGTPDTAAASRAREHASPRPPTGPTSRRLSWPEKRLRLLRERSPRTFTRSPSRPGASGFVSRRLQDIDTPDLTS